ncbi:MAG: hypothetical protein KJ067_25215 [Vicinamibacteria bacterium]|nr:hypothetical protein [Vicinamibacteria bacterium]
MPLTVGQVAQGYNDAGLDAWMDGTALAALGEWDQAGDGEEQAFPAKSLLERFYFEDVETVRHQVEVELHGAGAGWTDLTPDVRLEASGLGAGYGIRGAGPLDRVAETGTLRFNVDNSARNSAKTLGYYSPENTLRRPGWGFNIGVRYSVTWDGTTNTRHLGQLSDMRVNSDPYGPRDVACVSSDWFEVAAKWRITGVPTLTHVRADEALAALIAAAPKRPRKVVAGQGSEVYDYTFDTARGESALREGQRLVQSEFGMLFMRGSTDGGGVLVFEPRGVRRTAVAEFELSDYVDFDADQGLGSVRNRIKVGVFPRQIDASPVVLFTLQSTPTLAPGESLQLECVYVDPAQKAARVGGTSMEPPVATTDYAANALPDGSGADRTANLSVAVEFFSDRAKVTLTNTHASSITVTHTQLRGLGLYTYEPVIVEAFDQESIDDYDEQDLAFDMPYQSSPLLAKAVADAVLLAWKQPVASSARVRFCADRRYNPELFRAALQYDISSCIVVRDDIRGVNRAFWINGVDLDLDSDGIFWCTWYLGRAETTRYWVLDAVAPGEFTLGVDTLPAPF